MPKVNQHRAPVRFEDFTAQARDAASDGKLTKKEKKELGTSFKGLDRQGQQQGLDFLKNEPGVLGKFAQSNAVVRTADARRVGGDLKLDQFNASVDRAAADGKIAGGEQSALIRDYRALTRGERAQALDALRQRGDQDQLIKALEGSVLEPASSKTEGSKSIGDFNKAIATLKNTPHKGRNEVLEAFRGLAVADKEQAINSIKNELPSLAIVLDRILNPRPDFNANTPFNPMNGPIDVVF